MNAQVILATQRYFSRSNGANDPGGSRTMFTSMGRLRLSRDSWWDNNDDNHHQYVENGEISSNHLALLGTLHWETYVVTKIEPVVSLRKKIPTTTTPTLNENHQ